MGERFLVAFLSWCAGATAAIAVLRPTPVTIGCAVVLASVAALCIP